MTTDTTPPAAPAQIVTTLELRAILDSAITRLGDVPVITLDQFGAIQRLKKRSMGRKRATLRRFDKCFVVSLADPVRS